MIVLFLEGGLGNQLFQYSAAKTLSKLRGNDDIIIDTDFYEDFRYRRYELNRFKFPGIRIASENDKRKIKYKIAKKNIYAYRQRVITNKNRFNSLLKLILMKQGIYICGGTDIGDTRLALSLIRKRISFCMVIFNIRDLDMISMPN